MLDDLRAQRRQAAREADLLTLGPRAFTGLAESRALAALARAEAELAALNAPRTLRAHANVDENMLSPRRRARAGVSAAEASARFRLSVETERRVAMAAKARPQRFHDFCALHPGLSTPGCGACGFMTWVATRMSPNK